MGFDHSNHHVFAGDGDPTAVRAAVLCCINETLGQRADTEADAMRSIVVGPADRWIFVGDTAGSTEQGNPIAFENLAVALSNVAATVCIHVSDSAVVHFLLHENGALVDKFGNGKFPVMRFNSAEEAAPFRGDVSKWSVYLSSPTLSVELQNTWSQTGSADSIVEGTSRLLGMNTELCQVGYSIYDESREIKYTDWLQDRLDFGLFTELHFVSADKSD